MHPNSRIRRTHSVQFKAQVLSDCRQPGASVSSVALAHGLNVNVVRKWLAGHGMKRCASAVQTAPAPLEFVPVSVSAPAAACVAASTDIHLELDLGALQLKLHCARGASGSMAALLHALAEMVART